LVLTGTTSVACDSVSEWFPALTDRQSLYTVQGREWTLGDTFGAFIGDSADLQECLYEDPSCLDEKVGMGRFEYVYISRNLRVNNCKPLDTTQDFGPFIEEMQLDERFESVFEIPQAVVFKLK
jgi:hypothetical protein